jgi:hypothetical protein
MESTDGCVSNQSVEVRNAPVFTAEHRSAASNNAINAPNGPAVFKAFTSRPGAVNSQNRIPHLVREQRSIVPFMKCESPGMGDRVGVHFRR